MTQVKQTLNLLATKISDNLVLPGGSIFYGTLSTYPIFLITHNIMAITKKWGILSHDKMKQ